MFRNWLSRAEVRDVDRVAIEEYGLPGVVLMENAGRGCAELLVQLGARGPVVIACGKGNNGGDGYVIARHLDLAGIAVEIILTCEPAELRGDAAVHYGVIAKAQLPITIAPQAADWSALLPRLQQADWIVDALLGTGFEGAPREPLATAIRTINAAGRKVLAVDLPSGLDADTGQAAGECIQATRTATFVARKRGFLQPETQPRTGPVDVIAIGVPGRLLTSFGLRQECP
jgi:NAD(P)H-hydrate epimerase